MLPTASSQSTESMHMEMRSMNRLIQLLPQATDLPWQKVLLQRKFFLLFFFSSRLVFLLLCFMYFSFSPFTECGLHKCKGSCPPPLLVRNFTICRLQLTINFCLLWEGSFNQAAHCELNPFLLSQENNPSRLQ